MIDTHAHLDACDDSPANLLARARAAGVGRVVAVGTGIESCRTTLAIADAEPGVSCALGIHPHQSGSDEAKRLDDLRGLLRRPAAVAVGETGLDYYRDYAPPEAQKRVFTDQLLVAGELGLPVVVHTRAADDDTARLLSTFEGTVIMHCFSSPALLPIVLENGYYVSFAGNVTYPKAQELRDAAAAVPDDRILAETDCPYLAPQPIRGSPNEPANIVHTLTALAAARGQRIDELEALIEDNAARAFGLP